MTMYAMLTKMTKMALRTGWNDKGMTMAIAQVGNVPTMMTMRSGVTYNSNGSRDDNNDMNGGGSRNDL
jgi:hypothetical protein